MVGRRRSDDDDSPEGAEAPNGEQRCEACGWHGTPMPKGAPCPNNNCPTRAE